MPKLFVIMPFGSECGIDFDRVFFNLIQPAAKDARLEVVRMDQVSTPGRISDQTLRELYLADVALADVTAPNPNVFYELGIRQTMGRPTVPIARRDTVLPFDIREQRVLLYHAEPDQQIAEARTALASALREVLREPGQNPVQQFLNPSEPPQVPLTLADLADRLAKFEEWGFAIEVLREAVRIRPNDFELHRSLGFYSRKIGDYETAEICFRKAIELNPSDPETLGMLGGLLKRSERFAEAAEKYGSGAGIAPGDIYLRSNSIAMLLIAEPQKRPEALKQYEQLRKDLLALPPDKRDQWTECMTAEAHFVLGEDSEARRHFDLFVRLAKSANELLSPADQFDLLARHGFRPEESAEMAAWLRKMHRQLMEPATTPEKAAAPARVSLRAAQPGQAAAPPMIIHLSDVHFGSVPGKDGKPVRMHRFFDGDYSDKLVTHLLREFKSKRAQFSLEGRQGYLVVSGDLGYTATKDEFNEAREFLDELCRGLNISKDRVTLCPGNHDVNWAESANDRTRRFEPYLSFVKNFYGLEFFRKLYPFVKWDFQVDTERPHASDMVSLQLFEHQKMLILSLNSCVYETEEHHYGFVGGKQLQKADTLLDETFGRQDLLRVAVVHHHLHSFPEPVELTAVGEHWHDLSTIRDAALVEKYLQKNNFDLVFHGHKHKAQLRETTVRDPRFAENIRPLIVFGGGSCGVASRELEHSIPNQYQIVEVLSSPRQKAIDFLRVELREIAVAEGAEWVTAKTWTLQG